MIFRPLLTKDRPHTNKSTKERTKNERKSNEKKICVAANCVRHKKNQGITLVALVITIVIMLILSTVTIGAINGGLFDYAGKAKKDTEEVSKTTGIEESFILAKDKSKTGKITISDMQNALDKIFGENYAEAIENGDTTVVKIDDIYYEVDSKGNVGEGRTIVADKNAGDITKGGKYDGTSAKPYHIECIEDLVTFAKEVNTDKSTYTKFGNKYILLTKDLDFNSIFSYSNYNAKYEFVEEDNAYEPSDSSQTTIKELCTTGQGFIPIGSKSPKFFGGIFYGEEQRKIKNIYINRSDNAGLFDHCSGAYGAATIKNITIDGEITCTGGLAAGFIGSMTPGYHLYMENCINKATIKNTGTGGAVGLAEGPYSGRKRNNKKL